MQPVALAQHFGGHGRGHYMYPTTPARTNPGVPDQYGPSRDRGVGRGIGTRERPVCNKCKDAGKRGGDILHSYRSCPIVKSFRVHLVSTFPFFMRSPHIRATVQFRSVFQFIFLSGSLRDQMGDPGEGSAIIYDYFFESVYACRLCKTQRGPSLAWVRANPSPSIIFSDDAVWKYSRTFTTPRVVPFCSYLFHFLFYSPLNVQPRLQTILQTPLHLAFFWLGLWSTVERAERFRLILVHPNHPPWVC